MKRLILAALCIVSTAAPLQAQEQIEKLYLRMASDPKVSISQSIQVDRKPGASVSGKTSMCEINSFAIHKPNKKGRYVEHMHQYVSDIAAAIQNEASNPQCYRIASYRYPSADKPRQWNLLYGEDATQYVTIGKERHKNYIFACFADKANPGYRYCYALEWYELENDLFGRYMCLYAKMPEESTPVPEMVVDSVSYASVKKYNARVKYNTPDDPFTMFGSGKFGTDLTINAEDRTFTLGGKTLPLDSLTAEFERLKEISPIEAQMMTGNLVTAINKSMEMRLETFLKSFNALSERWMRGDVKNDANLPVGIYLLVKDAVNKNLLSQDEKELVNDQLIIMVEAAKDEGGHQYEMACRYLALAQKELKRSGMK